MSATPNSSQTWTEERVELLKEGFAAGLTCREIAADIGVSRNAVIGKLSRLNLTRIDARGRRRAEKKKRPTSARSNPRRGPQLHRLVLIFDLFGTQPSPEDPDSINEGNRRSLLELGPHQCRWPISTPGAADFCFCGNTASEGESYCPGHIRLAYRPTRLRASRA
ncbi:MAG: GcrA family cell cycle regulator [Alphaproteobacteria bacterium]|nr:GcrA family cell cycle regulator [Alphaproteobacteria bacterium]